ncbi:hypothetical protein Tco_0691252 [Tanacetum coccineum]
MGTVHIESIPTYGLDEVIKSSVEDLVQPSESEDCCLIFYDDNSSSDDDSPYGENIDYVDCITLPDVEIVCLEVVGDWLIRLLEGLIADISFKSKDGLLHEKLLKYKSSYC